MGQKVNPVGFRININKPWKSRWFSAKEYQQRLKEDLEIREGIKKQLKGAGIRDVEIERSPNAIRIIIYTSKPGVIIGRSGAGANLLREKIQQKIRRGAGFKTVVDLDVREVRHFEESATLVAQNIAEQLEKRISFRRALKATLDQVMKNQEVKGVKLMISGRLNGAEMSRREWLARGGIPLHTLRADIDFGKATAYTTHGTIGVKVWIYKGEAEQEQSS
ncbi:MAG: 30S ribosomal protein S3 [Candidatus Moranbacteria bacterium]|nr:30S ribosomal protein S3 [Candidatus Moranbacteria bacterium]